MLQMADFWDQLVPFCFLPQDESSSACNQMADVLQKKFSKEQQELQVSITMMIVFFFISVPFS